METDIDHIVHSSQLLSEMKNFQILVIYNTYY